MVTPEDFQARHDQSVAKAKELGGRIVRAQSWGQIFGSPEEAVADFQTNLVDAWRFYYGKDDPKVRYVVEPHPNGDIHRVTRDTGRDTTYQRFLNGDVEITFYSPDKPPSANLITPSIGNIDHPFTDADVIIPDPEVVDTLLEDPNLESKEAMHLTLLLSHLRGKPATQGWEDTMLYNGYVPQRIGHRLFPGYAIEALAKLREEYPQFVVRP